MKLLGNTREMAMARDRLHGSPLLADAYELSDRERKVTQLVAHSPGSQDAGTQST
jgi:hypothetical protein